MKTLILTLLFAAASFAQSQTHQAAMLWTDTANPSGTTYNVYRSTGACPATPPTVANLGTFTLLNAAPLTVKSYIDTSVASATTYCYGVTAVSGTQSSAFSPLVAVAVPTLYAIAQITVVAQ